MNVKVLRAILSIDKYRVLKAVDTESGIQLARALFRFYENHDVNTPPFMAGMKRHPLKTV